MDESFIVMVKLSKETRYNITLRIVYNDYNPSVIYIIQF